jgi:hypothetical protein
MVAFPEKVEVCVRNLDEFWLWSHANQSQNGQMNSRSILTARSCTKENDPIIRSVLSMIGINPVDRVLIKLNRGTYDENMRGLGQHRAFR